MEQKGVSLVDLLSRQRAWYVAIPFALALAALAIAGEAFLQKRAFDAQAVETTGQVIDKSRTRTRDGDSTRTTRRVRYAFEDQTGERHEARHDVSGGFYNSVDRGDDVTVRYLPDDPSVSEVEGRLGTFIMVWSGLAMVPLLVGLVWGRRIWHRTAAMLRAARQGEQRGALVIDHVGSRMKIGDQPASWHVLWSDDTGMQGKSLGDVWFAVSRQAPKGSTITLRIDPKTQQGFWERDLFGR